MNGLINDKVMDLISAGTTKRADLVACIDLDYRDLDNALARLVRYGAIERIDDGGYKSLGVDWREVAPPQRAYKISQDRWGTTLRDLLVEHLRVLGLMTEGQICQMFSEHTPRQVSVALNVLEKSGLIAESGEGWRAIKTAPPLPTVQQLLCSRWAA